MASTIEVRNKLAKFLLCELDCNSGILIIEGVQQKLEPLVHQFLLLLIRHQGNIVSKQKVLDMLWPNKKPSDEALRALVKKTREALQDNARNPSYINTIPTKGYLFIPVVELSSTVIQTWFIRHSKLCIWAALIFIVTVFILTWYLLPSNSALKDRNKLVLTQTKLGTINKNIVSTYYIKNSLKNVWIEEQEFNNASQVMIVDLATNFQQKIAFSASLRKEFWYSRGSQRLLVMRNDNKGFYSLHFSRQTREPSIIEYMLTLPSNTNIRGIDYHGNHLFLVVPQSNSLSVFSLGTGEIVNKLSVASIYEQFGIVENDNENSDDGKVADKNKTENTSLRIWPSPVSNGFMIGFDSNQKTQLRYYSDIDSEQPSNAIDVDGSVQSAVWNKQGGKFSFTNDNARLFSYQIGESKLISLDAEGGAINKVVADCGSNCFVVSNTQGVPKLSEFTNPFVLVDHKDRPAQASNPYALVIETNSIARNEYLPQYTSRGLYFVSQQQGDSHIIFRDNNSQERTIFSFNKQAIVEELSVNNNDNYLAGLVNQRPFLIDLNTRKLRYIPLTFPHVSQIVFESDNIIRFYAETASSESIDRNSSLPVETISAIDGAQQPNGLYEYSIQTEQISLLAANVKSRRQIELIDTNDQGSKRYKATLTLNSMGEVSVVFQSNRQNTVFNIAKNHCANCWQVSGNYLYQIHSNDSQGLSSTLQRINLLTGEQAQQPLLFTTLLNTFSLHPTSTKMMVVTRQDLQTDLTKIEGLSQIF